MEYFLGSVITLAILFVLDRKLSNNKVPAVRLRYSQSRSHSLFPAPRSVHYYGYSELRTQATLHSSSQSQNQMRVVLHEDDAYWIADNTLFTAKLSGDDIDRESTKIVDTMALDKVELNKLMIIVDKLTEGNSKNDNGNSGNKNIF
jgi:hypothetical protein